MMNSIRLIYIGDDSLDLTNGKIYDEYTSSKIESDPVYYCISKNDYGRRHWYQKYFFKTLEEVRNDKLLKILS